MIRKLLGTTALALASAVPSSAQGLLITEVMADSPATPDWFEVTNTSSLSVSLSGVRVDDNSFNFGSSAALQGVLSLAAFESVIFIDVSNVVAPQTIAIEIQEFRDHWGPQTLGLQIGYYTGSSIGFSKDQGDGVVLFGSSGAEITRVSFGAVTEHFTQRWTTGNPQGQSRSQVGDGFSYESAGTSKGATEVTARTDVGSPGLAIVPEPGSTLLFCLGALGIAARARRRVG